MQRAGNLTLWIPQMRDTLQLKEQVSDGAKLLSSSGFSLAPLVWLTAVICQLAFKLVGCPGFLELTTALNANWKLLMMLAVAARNEDYVSSSSAFRWYRNLGARSSGHSIDVLVGLEVTKPVVEVFLFGWDVRWEIYGLNASKTFPNLSSFSFHMYLVVIPELRDKFG